MVSPGLAASMPPWMVVVALWTADASTVSSHDGAATARVATAPTRPALVPNNVAAATTAARKFRMNDCLAVIVAPQRRAERTPGAPHRFGPGAPRAVAHRRDTGPTLGAGSFTTLSYPAMPGDVERGLAGLGQPVGE